MAILFSILLYGKRGWVVAAVGAFGWGALAVVSFIDRNRLIPWSTEHWFLDGAMFGPLVFVGLAFITDSRYSSACDRRRRMRRPPCRRVAAPCSQGDVALKQWMTSGFAPWTLKRSCWPSRLRTWSALLRHVRRAR